MTQLRFGIHGGQQNTTMAQYRADFEKAEELGFDWVSDFDHFIPIRCDPDGPCFDGLTTLAHMAAFTKKVQLGIIVTGVTYRSPAMLAKIAVTLDHLKGGRFELGMGAAWFEMEHVQYGIPFPRLGVRMDMLEEAIQIVQSLFTQKRTTFEGKHYQIVDALFEPKPLTKIPVWVGGAGEKRTLKIVGRYADGWNTVLMPMQDYQRKLGILEGFASEVGRKSSDIRKSLAFRAMLDTSRERAQERREAEGDKPGWDENSIVGTAQDAIERLKPYVEAGVHDFLLLSPPPLDVRTAELFVQDVKAGLSLLVHP